ncbi:MAG: hypothetical protein V3R68_05445 [Gammaproteobacteria bacterium]
MHICSFDWVNGGLKTPVKFLDRDSTEYSLTQAADYNRSEERMARMTLEKTFALLDPVWGGAYQYSTQGQWNIPHFRKTMASQSGHLRLYALAYSLWKQDRYIASGLLIKDYLKRFLTSPKGAFYTGQNDCIDGMESTRFFSLDDQQRIKAGMPDIDKRILTRENGWAIEALATFYEFTGNKDALSRARIAADWIYSHRFLAEGGYRHDGTDNNASYLADTLAMGRAMLQLYRVTTEDKWLRNAINAADYISQVFKQRTGGYINTVCSNHHQRPVLQIDDNISVTRFFNLLSFYSGKEKYRDHARHGLCYLSIPQVATARLEEAGILLIDHELSETPLEITIHGDKADPDANALFQIALREFGWYKLIKWKNHIPANENVSLDNKTTTHASAFVKKEDYSSSVIQKPEALISLLRKI